MKCPECGKKFKGSFALSFHRKNAHGIVPPEERQSTGWLQGMMILFLILGGFLTFTGLCFVLDRDNIYYSTSFLFFTINEGKLNQGDALHWGIALLVVGLTMIGTFGIYIIFCRKKQLKS